MDDKALGIITAFDADDRVGTLLLDDGRTIEFGRSACVGFEPFPNLRVGAAKVVRDATGTWAAMQLTLSEHPVKDVSTAAEPSTRATSPFAVDLRRGHFGWFTVLLDGPLPSVPEALAAKLEIPSLGRARVIPHPPRDAASPGREIELVLGGQHFIALEQEGPPAAQGLDLRHVPRDFEPGTHRLGIAPGVVDPLRLRAADPTSFPNPWGPAGQMRVASLLARRLLLDGAAGIVLHLAGNLVFTAGDFIRRLGPLENPECKPFGAWVDWVLSPDRAHYSSVGMHAFGALDVTCEILNRTAEVELDSAESGVLFACMLQARENRVLADGEEIYVPKDIRIGPMGASAKERTGYRYLVSVRDGVAELVRG